MPFISVKLPKLRYSQYIGIWVIFGFPTRYMKYCLLGLDSRVEDGRGSVKPRFPSPLIKPDVRSYRIRLTDWLHLKAHAVQQISSVLVTVRQVRQILSAKETDGCLASAPYAD